MHAKALPETDQIYRACNMYPFFPKNKDALYKDLKLSREQAARGDSQEMGQALSEIRKKYGL